MAVSWRVKRSKTGPRHQQLFAALFQVSQLDLKYHQGGNGANNFRTSSLEIMSAVVVVVVVVVAALLLIYGRVAQGKDCLHNKHLIDGRFCQD